MLVRVEIANALFLWASLLLLNYLSGVRELETSLRTWFEMLSLCVESDFEVKFASPLF